jgi:hypothetical protein
MEGRDTFSNCAGERVIVAKQRLTSSRCLDDVNLGRGC